MSWREPGDVSVEVDGDVATIVLDRSSRHNSLVPAFLDQIEAALGSVGDASAVVLRAEGSSFSTGGDVAAFDAHRDDIEAYADEIVGGLNRVVLGLIGLDAPIVTPVHGMVTGGSLGLVLASDVVLVSEAASFTPWYSEVGFAPDGGWTALLPEVIGRTRTADVLATNRTISAGEAVAWGLASRLVVGDVRSEAARVAATIARSVGGSVRHAKRGLWGDVSSIADRLDAERRRFVAQIVTDEVSEGMTRFLGPGHSRSRSAT